MKYNFEYRGYTSYDFYGSQTQKQTVVDYASAMEETFDYVAMFHHGHAGFKEIGGLYHYDFFDDDGPDYSDDQIWDYEVWPKTRGNKHFFVMLWACRQGDIEGSYHSGYGARGIPYAWLDPISRGDCFIGFKGASMPLTQCLDNPVRPYRDFVTKFYYYALYLSTPLSVIDALNEASKDVFGCTFDNTKLWTGFTAIWHGLQFAKNGGFERGDESHWTVGGPGDHTVTSEDRYSGSYSMLLGFKYNPPVANARDYAYQLIDIPPDAEDVKFSFRCHFFTYDRLDYDWFEAYVTPVNGTPDLVYKVGGQYRGVFREQPWIQVTTDISQYVGRKIYLYFAVANWKDAYYRTWCYIDDVSVTCTRNGSGQMKIWGNPNIYLHIPPSNSPPNTPATPSGPTSGYAGISYTYTTSTTDPDGDSVRYQFDWGDDSTTTTGWYAPGTQASASHSWSSPGIYNVKVRAQDSLNAWSGWSPSLTVNIESPPTYSLTVLAYNQYNQPGYVPLYIDGQYVGTTGYAYTVTAGDHQIYVESPLYNGYGYHFFQFYYYDGNYDYNNPTTLSVTSDKTIYAIYYSYYY